MKKPAISLFYIFILLLLIQQGNCSALLAKEKESFQKYSLMVTVNDGSKLATDIYRNPDDKNPKPVILVRTPYNKNGLGKVFAKMVTKSGYILVAQDMRGRFASDGSDSIVFFNGGWSQKRDGHETINWITSQPWSNGNVVTWGGSALGISQNMLAVDAPESLKAQYVQVAFSNMYSQSAYQGGVWRKSLIERWLKGSKFDPGTLTALLKHPSYSSFWDDVNPEKYDHRTHAPAIFYGGWYDIFNQGTINSFVSIQSQGQGNAKGNCRLVMGPYAHGFFTELKYPSNSTDVPKAGDYLRFFNHWAQGKSNGVEQDKAVHYYVMGDPEDADAPGNYWRSVDVWPPETEKKKLYFYEDLTASFDENQNESASLHYDYNPKDPVPTVGGQNLMIAKGPMDQRKVESRKDVLVFTTDVLESPVEVTGRIRAVLSVSSDSPDTDFTVKICDVYPDGRSMLVTDGIQKARFRKSFEKEEFMESGKVYQIPVDLWSTSLIFNKGHRIRISISSSNFPRFEPNPNTGNPFIINDPDTRVAHNTIHLSSRSPSYITLPVYHEGESN